MTICKKPLPLNASEPRRRCPVCGQTSYSAAGIHPQCAVRQADAIRMKRYKEHPPLPPKPPLRSEVRRWHKMCAKCHAQVHVRKKTCDCGHIFTELLPVAASSARR